MHNCREIKEHLTETMLDGRSDELLSAELSRCAECRAEFEALNATLRMTKRLSEASVPAESYWSGYHDRLREKLSHAKVRRRRENTGASFAPLRLCARTLLFPVPVPLSLAVLLVCFALGLVIFRAAPKPVAQSPVVVHMPVEVPVVQEKVVTRVVYRDRYMPSSSSKRIGRDSRVESTFARSQKPRTEDIPSLTGFKPTEDVKLTVIKGGIPNEK